MVIVVTGAIGIGKTTVCRKLVETVRHQGYTCGGILTYKAADESIVIENIQSGEKETLASIRNIYHGPRTTKYFFNPKGIDFGVQAIDKGTSRAVLVVDEVGHLELRGEGFTRVLELIRIGKVENCVLVIRQTLLSAFLPKLPDKPLVFETTVDNRHELPQKIASALVEEMH